MMEQQQELTEEALSAFLTGANLRLRKTAQ